MDISGTVTSLLFAFVLSLQLSNKGRLHSFLRHAFEVSLHDISFYFIIIIIIIIIIMVYLFWQQKLD